MIGQLCVVGVGLIGGSLSLALREKRYCGEVIGCGRDEDSLRKAVELNVIDRYVMNPERAVRGADMVVLAVPLGAMESVLHDIAPSLSDSAIITDVGSSKGSVVAAARVALGPAFDRFVPGHPIAGTERNGVEAAFASLFRHRRVILTPLTETRRDSCDRVRAMWGKTGATVEEMAVSHHDQVLAATSHLPHLLAFALVDSLARIPDHEDIFRYAAGGFRDFTRIASSDPVIWRDICLANREALLDVLARYQDDMQEIVRAIELGDGKTLQEIFARARAARERYVIN
jgi:prephenate dehydrogenase